MSKGKQPRPSSKVSKFLLSCKGSRYSSNSQEVGSEAATLQRKRNSSLVDGIRRRKFKEDKQDTEDRGPGASRGGRGALIPQRRSGVSRTGVVSSENAGMSSESPVRIWTAEYPRFPTKRSSRSGKSVLSRIRQLARVGDG